MLRTKTTIAFGRGQTVLRLVPNLVDSVKGYAAHERSVLEEVTQLRGAARALPQGDVAARTQAEGALSAAIGKLFAVRNGAPSPPHACRWRCAASSGSTRPARR